MERVSGRNDRRRTRCRASPALAGRGAAPATHANRFRWWLEEKAESRNGSGPVAPDAAASTADSDATS